MRRWCFLFTAVAVIASVAHAAGEVDARLEVEPKEIPWHKTVSFAVVIEAPADAEVTVDDVMDHLGGLQPFGDVVIKTEPLPDGRKRTTHQYTLESPKAEPGSFQPEPVIIRVKDGDTITLPSPEIKVRELTPEEEAQAQEMAPILDPLNVKKRFWEYWQFWAGIAAAAVIATTAFVLYRWFKRQRPAKPQRIVPPWETALSRLAALEAKGLRDSGRLDAYYVELSAILRHYIEDRFDLRAPERTTPEFLAEAAGGGALSDDQQRMLASFLRYSDRVKFAKFEPTMDDAARNYTDVKRFVEETVPAPAPEEAAA
ncbi:MAG: hypothetical protein HUU46_13435 [Candidatus Hydrogenedentes bacterium]|nr:hypothetical protein [Candidatus Hydrogenedentota bacterium]